MGAGFFPPCNIYLDNLATTELEVEGLVPVVGGIELLAILGKGTEVVHLQRKKYNSRESTAKWLGWYMGEKDQL